MANSETNQTTDLSEHKRKIFFENLSNKTTTDSLREYLSGFPCERCIVPSKEGKNQGHGYAIFCKESSVNTLMSKRPHRIDDRPVEIYRSVPDQGSLKEKKGVKNLIVSGVKQGSLNKSDLEHYFSGFGKINSIDLSYGEDSCRIEFEDYDAVDKALLDVPHTIKQTKVNLKKGSRNNQPETMMQSRNNQITSENNNTSTIPKKSIIKQVKIDSQISTVNIPEKIYCIHIQNLPRDANAEVLSKEFGCPVYNILLNSSLNNQSSPVECWLKDIDDFAKAKQFVQQCDGKIILGSKIECEIEEDKLEFCKHFRLGKCGKTDDECDWTHIECTANGKCSNSCPYGHAVGMKTGYPDTGSNMTYRIKITGFREKLTPTIMARILRFTEEKKCYIQRSHDLVGYLVQLRTIKYARRLMLKWHKREINGQTLQCQLELNPVFPVSRTPSGSALLVNKENKNHQMYRRSHSCERIDDSTKTSRDSSFSWDDEDSGITILNDRDINDNSRLFSQSRDQLVKQKSSDKNHKASSSESLVSSVHPKLCLSNNVLQSEGTIANENKADGRQMSQIRKKEHHGSLASLVEYKDTDSGNYHRELDALQILKGVKGVAQLLDSEDTTKNRDQRFSPKHDFWFITEHVSGSSLKEFVSGIHRGGFTLLEAVKLSQNLITIIKRIHSRGVLHQNLEPENITIEWDSKKSSIDQAQLTVTNFSQAYIKSDKSYQMNKTTTKCWYKAPQSDVESFKYSSTNDASNICAILLWLLTNTNPKDEQGLLPHQQKHVKDEINKKIAQGARIANANRKQVLEEKQLQMYIIDTFNIGFGYPGHQPWTISDLECRLESIYELLSPRNPKLIVTDAIFQELLSTYSSTTTPAVTIGTDVHQDAFQKASNAFHHAKKTFSDMGHGQYSWSDGCCKWLDSTQTSLNGRRHDDVLTYSFRDRHMSSSCSIIITCLATLIDQGNYIILSISSAANGKMSRIPIGQFGTTQSYMTEFPTNFTSELNNLIISICKERKAIEQ